MITKHEAEKLKLSVSPASVRLLSASGHKIDVIGKTKTVLEHQSKSVPCTIHVCQGTRNVLLRVPEIKALRLIRVVDSLGGEAEKEKSAWISKYAEVFEGWGCLKEQYCIKIKEPSSPVSASTPQRVPLHLRRKLQEELENVREEQVIEPVSEPSGWCSPIVVVPKKNGKKSQSLRH